MIKYFLHHQYQAFIFSSFLVAGIERLLFLFLMHLASSTFRFVFIVFQVLFQAVFPPNITIGLNNFRVLCILWKEHRLRNHYID